MESENSSLESGVVGLDTRNFYGTTRLAGRFLLGERQVSRSGLADSQASIVFANDRTGGEDDGCHSVTGQLMRIGGFSTSVGRPL